MTGFAHVSIALMQLWNSVIEWRRMVAFCNMYHYKLQATYSQCFCSSSGGLTK